MMRWKSIVLTVSCLSAFTLAAYGQPGLDAAALSYKGKGYVMWVPRDFASLKQGVNNGYVVRRQAYALTDGTPIPWADRPAEREIFTSPPQDSAAWSQRGLTDESAEVLYMTIFDRDATPVLLDAPTLRQVDSTKSDETNRQLLASIALATDFQLARDFGCGFIDLTTHIDTLYQYYVYTNTASTTDRTRCVVRGQQAADLLSTIELDTPIVRSDETSILGRYARERLPFVSYDLQRGMPGSKNWQSVTSLPIVPLIGDDGNFVLVDSIPDCNQIYRYRAIAKGPFGILTQTAMAPGTVSCAVPAPVIRPMIDTIIGYPNEFRAAVIASVWDSLRSEVAEMTLEVSEQFATAYTNIGPFSNSKGVNVAYATNLPQSLYFRVKVVSQDGNVFYSVPRYHQPIDEIIPPPVSLLEYEWSGYGELYLRWRKSAAEDVRGYRVYKANVCGGNWAEITNGPYGGTELTTSIDLGLENKELALAIQPVDHHDNQDSAKTCIIIPRPDVHAPWGARVIRTKDLPEGLGIVLSASTSDDIERYRVIRFSPNGPPRRGPVVGGPFSSAAQENDVRPTFAPLSLLDTILGEFPHTPDAAGEIRVLDPTTAFNELYFYRVIAFDSTGNARESEPFQCFGNGRGLQVLSAPDLKYVDFDPDMGTVQLDFTYGDTTDLVGFRIYRTQGPSAPFVLHATLTMPHSITTRTLPPPQNPYANQVVVATPPRRGTPLQSFFSSTISTGGLIGIEYFDADAPCSTANSGGAPGYGYYIIAEHSYQDSPQSDQFYESCQ